MKKRILVTGGTGYIGSHTVVELQNSGYEVVIVDNLSNSRADVVDSIEQISGVRPAFEKVDCLDYEGLDNVFAKYPGIQGIIHFAASKAVGESVQKPLEYYYNNLLSTITLCDVMQKYDCKKIIFSSSATVYGNPKTVPINEMFPTGGVTNPYGATKLMCERILKDLYSSDNDWSICLLRYFNPIGGHESGLLGEEPNGIPNNLMPYIVKVAAKELPYLNVFGNDYHTKDGTGVRDFIHVVDLAKGHVKALNKVNDCNGVHVYNLGTGKGYSVLELVRTFEKTNSVVVPYVVAPRRMGDIAECYSDPNKAYKELGWRAEKSIDDMCKDSWRYFINSKGEMETCMII